MRLLSSPAMRASVAAAALSSICKIAAAQASSADTAPELPPQLGQTQGEISAEYIQRGRYLSRAADCIACHTAPAATPTLAAER